MKLKSKFCIILAILFSFSNVVSRAATEWIDVDNLRYTVDTETQTAELYGPASSSTVFNDLVIPDYIPYNDEQIPVTTIRNEAFRYNENLNGSLTIGNNVQTIGDYAFSGCRRLSGLLTIGDNVQTIGDYAFSGCEGFIGSLTIPDKVQTIGSYAFYYCRDFDGLLTIGDNVQSIGDRAFRDCCYLTGSLTIPDDVQTIGAYAFMNCYEFDGSLTIGDNVQTIGPGAFRDCSGLTGSLTIGNNVQTIGEAAFERCSGLTGSLTIPDNVQTIGGSAFRDCSGLTGSLTIPDNVQTIGGSAFRDCSGLTGSLTIPDNVETIGDGAFMGCSGLTGSLTIGNFVQTIGHSAFSDCSGFTGELRIPEFVKEIGSSCFANCEKFSSLVITSSNTVINNMAFVNDYGLMSITCLAPSPPKCVYGYNSGSYYDYVFGGTMYSTPLYVPAESINLYKTATEWEKFQYINPITTEATDIKLNKSELELLIGESETLTATITPEDATEEIVWSVNEEGKDIVSVDQNGKVTALAVGEAIVKATAGDVSATCTVTVNPVTASSITLNVQDMTLLVCQSDKLTATVEPENVTDKTITWKSDNEAVATVAADGTITAVSAGTATITATCGEATATCKVIVKGSDIITVTPGEGGDDEDWLDGSNVSVHVDQSVTVEVTLSDNLTTQPQLVWALADGGSTYVKLTPAEDTLSATFTGLSVGNTSYTISIGDKELAGGTVTVTAPVDDEFELTFGDAAIDVDGVTILLGETFTLTPKAKEGYVLPANITWSSSADQIASVDGAGVVTGVAVGTADITASATVNGQTVSATCKVTVNPVAASAVTISVENAILFVGQSCRLTAEVEPKDTTNPTITWTSDNDAVAIVDTEGNVKALSAGTANISATCGDVSATCVVTVKALSADDVTFTPGIGTTEGNADGTNADNTEKGGSLSGNDLTLRVGQTSAIVLEVNTASDVEPEFVWTLADGGDAIVTMAVSNDDTRTATFKGLAIGTTAYSVKLAGADTELAVGKVSVIAENPVTSMTIEPAEVMMAQNAQPLTLTATIEPDNASATALIWTSSDDTVVTVSSDGTVIPVGIGSATVTANTTDGSGVSATAVINVVKVSGLNFGISDESGDENGNGLITDNILKMYVGLQVNISVTTVPVTSTLPELSWTVDDTSIATVHTQDETTSQAIVSGMSVGRTTLTVALADDENVSASVDVTVYSDAGVDEIFADGDNNPIDVFALDGKVVMLKAESADIKTLSKGFYIVRRGTVAKAILVR